MSELEAVVEEHLAEKPPELRVGIKPHLITGNYLTVIQLGDLEYLASPADARGVAIAIMNAAFTAESMDVQRSQQATNDLLKKVHTP